VLITDIVLHSYTTRFVLLLKQIECTKVWRHKKHSSRISRLHYYCQKVLEKIWIMVKIWWKLTKRQLRYERGTECKITKTVWRYVFVQLLISQQIFVFVKFSPSFLFLKAKKCLVTSSLEYSWLLNPAQLLVSSHASIDILILWCNDNKINV